MCLQQCRVRTRTGLRFRIVNLKRLDILLWEACNKQQPESQISLPNKKTKRNL